MSNYKYMPDPYIEKAKKKKAVKKYMRYSEAVEIYSKENDRMCSEGIYHLWVLSKNAVIPFGLNRKKMKVVSRNYKRDPIGFVAELARMWKLST